jgi:hypothetical protein
MNADERGEGLSALIRARPRPIHPRSTRAISAATRGFAQ